ncbi:hypothetical protein GCM10009850_117670 [Nonomuraea monospora]|uniref:Periplasmic binding protein domain-containing protein n=1 Tax=Nonomuraea monospora TaxID=568818 RepID=A0ABN3D378_9ACTN
MVGQPPTKTITAKGGGLAWVVSCGESLETCATPTAGALAAAKAAGFETKLCDGKLNPQGWSECIRQGISAKAAGILIVGQDCASFQAALREAQAAKIPTIGAGGNDCDVTGGQKLFSASIQKMPGMTSEQWWNQMGALQADWIIGRTGGQAQVLSTMFTDAIWGDWIQDGFTQRLGTCAGCKVLDTVQISNQDVASGQLGQKFSTALLKQPTANAVNFPIDGWFFTGLGQAVRSSGRTGDLRVIGAFGDQGNLRAIAENSGQDATVAFSAEWDGWAGVDALIRVLAGQDAQPAGIGLQAIDADRNMPQSGTSFAYNPKVDFEAAYKSAWGIS